MNLTSFQASLPSLAKSGKSFIAVFFGLFLLCSGLVARGDFVQADSDNLNTIRIDTSNIRTTLTQLNGALGSQIGTDLGRIHTKLEAINYALQSGGVTWTQLDDIKRSLSTQTSRLETIRDNTAYLPQDVWDLLSAVRSIAASVSNGNSSGSSTITNIVNVTSSSPDVLAGNPWWSTNSGFVTGLSNYSYAFPDDGKNNANIYSFPQFLSVWSGRLQGNADAPSNIRSDARSWQSLFGSQAVLSYSDNTIRRRGYTWFDWVSDAMRSNWVLQASVVDTIKGLTPSTITNVVNLSPSITNEVAIYQFITNLVNVSVALTNVLNSPGMQDILAGNPWWYTNSVFAPFYDEWFQVYPQSEESASSDLHSFPQAYSFDLSSRHRDVGRLGPYLSREWFDLWGRDSDRVGEMWDYTFNDWIADVVRSNLVLVTANSSTQLVQELRDYGEDTSDPSITNTPLPQYSLPSSETIDTAQTALEEGEISVQSFIEALPHPGTGGSPEIVVIPEFTVGGIHVREYRASLATSIVPVCRSVCMFLYGVALAVYIFNLARSDYQHFASLGRYWGQYK